jgi:hypothetical protein
VLLLPLTFSQIWLHCLVHDHQPTYFTNFGKRKHHAGSFRPILQFVRLTLIPPFLVNVDLSNSFTTCKSHPKDGVIHKIRRDENIPDTRGLPLGYV